MKEDKYIKALKKYTEEATTSDPKTGACWEGYERVPNTKKGTPGSCRRIGSSEADYKYENHKTGEIFIYFLCLSSNAYDSNKNLNADFEQQYRYQPNLGFKAAPDEIPIISFVLIFF